MAQRLPLVIFAIVMAAIPFIPGVPPFWIVLLDNIGLASLVAMGLARVPLRAFARYRSIHVQNLAQSAISAATFGAGNSLLLPIGIPFLLGRSDLVLPLLGCQV